MKCPRDGTELQKVDTHGIELDKCHKCDGIWFDSGELERLRGETAIDVEEELEKRYGDPSFVPGETDGYMVCPRCGGNLQGQMYSYIKPVRTDTCSGCYGVWLDDTELDHILDENKDLKNVEAQTDAKSIVAALGQLFSKKK